MSGTEGEGLLAGAKRGSGSFGTDHTSHVRAEQSRREKAELDAKITLEGKLAIPEKKITYDHLMELSDFAKASVVKQVQILELLSL